MPYPTLGASNRLRIEQYVPLLRAEDIEITVAPYFSDAAYRVFYEPGRVVAKAVYVAIGALRRVRHLLRALSYDLVLIHREAMPLGPPLVERFLVDRRIPYAFDFDDAIFLPGIHPAKAIHPANRQWARLRRPNAGETARRAQLVIAGNEYLAEWARQENDHVVVIPTPVDTARHTPRADQRREGPLVIGWVGSPSTAPYLRMLDGVFARLATRHTFIVRVIGGQYAHETVAVECIPYSLCDEPEQIQGFDIGILPEPDNEWTKGKGAFKALLYMASRVPVVASAVGVNEEVVGSGGFCVRGDEAWVAALDRLLADEALRRSVGDAGRRRSVESYSVSVQAPRFAAALRMATRGRSS